MNESEEICAIRRAQERSRQEIERIAETAARLAAHEAYHREMSKGTTPYQFKTVVGIVSIEIGTTLNEAGFAYASMNIADQDALAAQALREIGYPERNI